MSWINLAQDEVTPSINNSLVYQLLKTEGGEWEDYTSIPLTMAEASSFMRRSVVFCAIQNKDGIIYDRIIDKTTPETGWQKKSEGKEVLIKDKFEKQIYEIQQSLHEIDQALNEIRTNAKDSL